MKDSDTPQDDNLGPEFRVRELYQALNELLIWELDKIRVRYYKSRPLWVTASFTDAFHEASKALEQLFADERNGDWKFSPALRPSSNATAEILESSEYGFEEPPEYSEGGPPEYRLEESYELAVDSQPADLRMGERTRLEGHPDSFREIRSGLHQTPHVGKTITRLVIMRTFVCRALLVPPLFVKNPSVGKNFMLVASPLQNGMTLGSMFVEKSSAKLTVKKDLELWESMIQLVVAKMQECGMGEHDTAGRREDAGVWNDSDEADLSKERRHVIAVHPTSCHNDPRYLKDYHAAGHPKGLRYLDDEITGARPQSL